MAIRYEENEVVRRTPFGGCFVHRVCTECSRKYIGERKICPQCRYAKQKSSGKYNKKYHRNYYKKFLSKTAIKLNIRTPKTGLAAEIRRAAFDKQKKRIHEEVAAIETLGLSVMDTIGKIESQAAGLMMKAV